MLGVLLFKSSVLLSAVNEVPVSWSLGSCSQLVLPEFLDARDPVLEILFPEILRPVFLLPGILQMDLRTTRGGSFDGPPKSQCGWARPFSAVSLGPV